VIAVTLKVNMDRNKTDIELIGLLLKGDQSKFQELYARYKRNVFLVCLRYAKNRSDAEDFLQDSFINIYKSMHQYDDKKGKLGAWMNRIAINTCLMHLRKKSLKLVSSDIVDDLSSKKDSSMSGLDKLSLQELTQLIQSLPNGYRVVFNMYIIDGYTHKEIAEHLSISISTSKSQLYKARTQLQNILKSTNQELKYG